MAIIQQALLNRTTSPASSSMTMIPTTASFGGTEQEGSTSGYGIPAWGWQNSGTNMVSNGTRGLIPDHTTTNHWFVYGSGTASPWGGSWPKEACGMRTTDNGLSWTQSGISNVMYDSSANFTTWYGWDTNGSTSSPVWIVAGGAYPNSSTTTSGGSDIAIYKSTNLTSWSRIRVTPDHSYGGSTINQTFADVCYCNGSWVLLNAKTGNTTRSTNNGSSWSSHANCFNSFSPGIKLATDGNSKIVASGNNGFLATSTDSGASWSRQQYPTNNTRMWGLNYITGSLTVGSSTKGPGVWVAMGGNYTSGWANNTSDGERMVYSEDGTNWSEIDVNNDTNLPYRGTHGSLKGITDTKEGLFLTWTYDGSVWELYGSHNSLTNWFKISDNPFVGTMNNGSPYTLHGGAYYNKRYMIGSGIGPVYRGAAGRMSYIDFT